MGILTETIPVNQRSPPPVRRVAFHLCVRNAFPLDVKARFHHLTLTRVLCLNCDLAVWTALGFENKKEKRKKKALHPPFG